MNTNMPDTLTIPLRDWPQEELEGIYRVVGQLCCEMVRLTGLGDGAALVEVTVENGKATWVSIRSPLDAREQEHTAHTKLIEQIAERVKQAHDEH